MAVIGLLATTPKIKTDIHSHLLPGIDDGCDKFEESLELLRLLNGFGYERFVITPHVMHHKYDNSKEHILSLFEKFKQKIKNEGLNVRLYVAAEYYLDEHFMELVESRDVLSFGDDYLLFELSFSTAPLFLDEAVFVMQSKGYKPVLAHPERYFYMHNSFDKYLDLKNKGVKLQLNINSFSGYYSKPVEKMAKRLFKEGLIDFLGSDTHGMRHIDALKHSIKTSVFKKYFKNNNILNDIIEL